MMAERGTDLSEIVEIPEDVANLAKWNERYFFLKANGEGLSLSHLSEKEDMAPVSKLLSPFHDGEHYVLKLPSVKPVVSDNAKIIAGIQQYEIGLGGKKLKRKTLPNSLHLFVLKATRIDTEGNERYLVLGAETEKERDNWISIIERAAHTQATCVTRVEPEVEPHHVQTATT